ncbi:MAG: hypothetical protein OEZ65_16135 [Gemmatimonadota bacterium]|nr:hypothetical protein [Gemmatimonadota bacterium]MDH5761093.1 hypothetical protein [Gemmatimonadota bacterium]
MLEGSQVSRFRFSDPDEESRFRRAVLSRDQRQAAVVTALVIPVGLVFLVSDYALFGWSGAFARVAAIRIAWALLGIMNVLLISRAKTAEGYDRLLLVFLLLVAATLLAVDSTRPPTYTGNAIIEVLAVLAFYVGARTQPYRQLFPAAVLSVGACAMLLTVKEPEGVLTPVVVLVSFALANVMGFLLSGYIELSRRTEHAHLAEETKLRVSLQEALQEIRTLRGILPICAYCKKIRDEVGDWRPVEVYVRDRSSAEFSHSLCPDCVARYDLD